MIESKNNIVLLLTGTINPNSRDMLAVKEPEVRKKQYIDAIFFYLKNTNFKIVFTENSGTSLAEYFEKNERIEFLTYLSPSTLPEKGKGHKELEIINYSIENSKFINNDVAVMKITGRLKILNISQLQKQVRYPKSGLRKIVISNVYKAFKMDSRCFLFTLDFCPVLLKHGESINLHFSFERALWKAICEYDMSKDGKYRQFSQPLRIQGISGGLGIPYKNGLIVTIARQLRHFFLPFVYSKFRKNSL